MKHATLVFLRKDDHILLAMKKRGFGEGRWNGVGGKVDTGETVVEAAIRESQEEISVTPVMGEQVAEFDFKFANDSDKKGFDMTVHVFLCTDWHGEPTESEEMRPEWFAIQEIPYEQMWSDDQIWLPHVLDGEKLKGWFEFDDEDKVSNYSLEVI